MQNSDQCIFETIGTWRWKSGGGGKKGVIRP